MIEINRCAFCKNYKGLSYGSFGIPMCKAFPDGIPIDYNEFKNPGQKCTDEYGFDMQEGKADKYERTIGQIEKNIKAKSINHGL